MPQGGLLAVFEAFLDESERPDGTFTVAGYVFAPRQVEQFTVEWHRVMAPYWPFHMTELVSGRDKIKRPTPLRVPKILTAPFPEILAGPDKL